MTRSPYDLVIRNGVVVTGDDARPLDVGVRDGRIAALVSPGARLDGDEVVDAEGHLLLPGGIDTHTHTSWPYGDGAMTDDGFDGSGAAAAGGGTTTLIDFVPAAAQGTRLFDAAQERIDRIEAESPIDVGLHQIVTRLDAETLDDIPRVIDAGLTSFKMFTTYERDRVNDGQIWNLMQCMVRNGGLPGFHAENHDMIEQATGDLVAEGRTTMRDFEAGRPAVAEAAAIETVTLMARQLDTPVYIFHVSGDVALGAIDLARSGGSRVYAETCTHYLTFDSDVFSGDDSWKFSITPPIRSAGDREKLWAGVRDGRITSVGSDHCAYPAVEKAAHGDDYRAAPLGAAGVQNRSSVLWDLTVNRRGHSPNLYARITAERAARALGMYPRKGVLAVGSDADIVVLDPDRQWNGADLLPATPETFCLYDDYEGRGLPRHVLSRGRFVVRDFAYCGTPGQGGFLRRARIAG